MARILIVEPSGEIAELLGLIVSRSGHDPVLYRAGEETPEVDVVTLEPAFPGGFELVERLREEAPRLPVVCVSIFPPTEAVRALDPVAHLIKPFTLADFEQALAAALGRSAAIV